MQVKQDTSGIIITGDGGYSVKVIDRGQEGIEVKNIGRRTGGYRNADRTTAAYRHKDEHDCFLFKDAAPSALWQEFSLLI